MFMALINLMIGIDCLSSPYCFEEQMYLANVILLHYHRFPNADYPSFSTVTCFY
jgi:hypothetical protein